MTNSILVELLFYIYISISWPIILFWLYVCIEHTCQLLHIRSAQSNDRHFLHLFIIRQRRLASRRRVPWAWSLEYEGEYSMNCQPLRYLLTTPPGSTGQASCHLLAAVTWYKFNLLHRWKSLYCGGNNAYVSEVSVLKSGVYHLLHMKYIGLRVKFSV